MQHVVDAIADPAAMCTGVATSCHHWPAMTVRPPRIRVDMFPENRLISRVPRVTGRGHGVLTYPGVVGLV
jgi:hypothetical protein